mgnify:CR=1 FL=1
MNFNSIKVRLEHKQTRATCGTSDEFQFHKGTIRTLFKLLIFAINVISIP